MTQQERKISERDRSQFHIFNLNENGQSRSDGENRKEQKRAAKKTHSVRTRTAKTKGNRGQFSIVSFNAIAHRPGIAKGTERQPRTNPPQSILLWKQEWRSKNERFPKMNLSTFFSFSFNLDRHTISKKNLFIFFSFSFSLTRTETHAADEINRGGKVFIFYKLRRQHT